MNNVDFTNINLLSLCSGSGQLDIAVASALRRHGISSRALVYAEREAAAIACLRSRMEESALEPAPIWGGNLEQFPAERFRGLVDGIVAGFPCQPHSVAGKGEGRDDERNLLPAILKITDTSGARILFLENVAGLKREFDYICATLLQGGWDVEWGCLRAADVGASHRRERWFGVAYRSGAEWRSGNAERRAERRESFTGSSGELLDNSTGARRESPGQRTGAVIESGECLSGEGRGIILANSERPRLEGHRRNGDGGSEPGRIAQEPAGPVAAGCGELGNTSRDDQRRDSMPGEHGEGRETGGSGGDMANCDHAGRERQGPAESKGRERDSVAAGAGGELGDSDEQRERQSDDADFSVARRDPRDGPGRASLPIFAPGPADPRWAGILARCPFLAPALPTGALRLLGDRMGAGTQVEAQPAVRLLANGLGTILEFARADMLRIAGNGVVPQCAEWAFTQLLARILT